MEEIKDVVIPPVEISEEVEEIPRRTRKTRATQKLNGIYDIIIL